MEVVARGPEPRSPFDDVVRQARIASALPALKADEPLTRVWSEWLAGMDEALERLEVAAREDSLSLSLAVRRLREDLDRSVAGSGARLFVDTDAAEVVIVRALRLALRPAKQPT